MTRINAFGEEDFVEQQTSNSFMAENILGHSLTILSVVSQVSCWRQYELRLRLTNWSLKEQLAKTRHFSFLVWLLMSSDFRNEEGLDLSDMGCVNGWLWLSASVETQIGFDTTINDCVHDLSPSASPSVHWLLTPILAALVQGHTAVIF